MDKEDIYRISKYSIRTSDRRTFRDCLRRWDFQSSMRQNLQRKGVEQNIHFWFGSAIHFAMEDYHGYNVYGDPRKALFAYYKAFPNKDLPAGAESYVNLGMSMLSYYLEWLPIHNKYTNFETVWLNAQDEEVEPHTEGARPLLEQSFNIPLNVHVLVSKTTDKIVAIINEHGCTPGTYLEEKDKIYWTNCPTALLASAEEVTKVPIFYHGTMDRIVKDYKGRWWILDYKTAKGADTNKLQTDDQISAYLWAAMQVFNKPIYGFIYLQLTKEAVKEPKRLKNGDLSTDKKQLITYQKLRNTLIQEYGSIEETPSKYIEFLNTLALQEEPEGDRFIRWDFVKRSIASIANTARHIYGELYTMLNPNIYCYPTFTRDCIWKCPFRDACLAMEDNAQDLIDDFLRDWEQRPRNEDGNIEPWRENLIDPKELQNTTIEDLMSQVGEFKITINGKDPTVENAGFNFMYEEE